MYVWHISMLYYFYEYSILYYYEHYLCVCVVYMLICLCVYMCVEARGQCHSLPYFWDQSYSLDLGLTDTRWVGQWASEVLCLCH